MANKQHRTTVDGVEFELTTNSRGHILVNDERVARREHTKYWELAPADGHGNELGGGWVLEKAPSTLPVWAMPTDLLVKQMPLPNALKRIAKAIHLVKQRDHAAHDDIAAMLEQ